MFFMVSLFGAGAEIINLRIPQAKVSAKEAEIINLRAPQTKVSTKIDPNDKLLTQVSLDRFGSIEVYGKRIFVRTYYRLAGGVHEAKRVALDFRGADAFNNKIIAVDTKAVRRIGLSCTDDKYSRVIVLFNEKIQSEVARVDGGYMIFFAQQD